MNLKIITEIEKETSLFLTQEQQQQLHQILTKHLLTTTDSFEKDSFQGLVKLFLAAKRVEGCSEKTVRYYDSKAMRYTNLSLENGRYFTLDGNLRVEISKTKMLDIE